MKKKVEVYILAGFLGSGKTTLLTQMLKEEQQANRKVAVVMNELGKVSIDSDAVPKSTPLSELFDGCICCTIQEKLESTLQELLLNNDLDAIYIETTGAAHPIEVLDTILSPIFVEQFTSPKIITLLDILRWRDRDILSVQIKQLIREQVKHAEMLIINKVDLVSEAEVGSILFELQAINPHAKTLLTNFSKIPPKSWMQTHSLERSAHTSTHVKDNLYLKTFVYQFQSSIDLNEFEDWLRKLPETIYRIKGYINFKNTSGIYLFQYSYGTPLYMKELVKVPLNLVLIGENLNTEQIKAELQDLENK
ncbi:CobW family GTP-binding protein [Sutcliffiella rhizosphaerae]|uniref:Metal chaperone YciC n=1 Tax=Sutcliffiella rhizosphaerae TaxID=2880967 RepID=A0ABN8AE13_9BACI|nr:GTP-binding protein [Sutcliffiella rhizosphaerae]CAG9621972.1 Putative metal chaperone YciC [Sutcliffiella rhizosphaerae]